MRLASFIPECISNKQVKKAGAGCSGILRGIRFPAGDREGKPCDDCYGIQ